MIKRFAHRAESATRRSLTISVLCALMLLMVPSWFSLAKQNPYLVCARFYSYEITEQSFDLSDPKVIRFYSNGEEKLAAPRWFPDPDTGVDVDVFKAAVESGKWFDVFDRLALLNDYYRDMLLPIMLLLTAMSFLMIISLSGMLAGLMGMGRKMSHALPYSKRVRIFAACSWIPALPAFLVGFFIPIFHLFVYQLIVGYCAWQTQKRL